MVFWMASVFILMLSSSLFIGCNSSTQQTPPNILFVISDDQSYPHASAYGSEWVQTPAFDRIASEGILFTNCIAASPGCSPSRAAILTGRNCWQLESAGTHASDFPTKYLSFQELLTDAGYHTGFTGKPWGPGNYTNAGRMLNPAGKEWNEQESPSPPGISSTDYAANFADFFKQRKIGQPFSFWFGAREPHRIFGAGNGLKTGKSLESVSVPGFLPDHSEIRKDLLDYAAEIEWFDSHLGKIIAQLEEAGELENTLIIVTSDNGMAFPRAKANLYEYGIHVPLAIRWGAKIKGGRTIDDLVSFTDFAPTILEASQVSHPGNFPMTGKSMISLLTSDEDTPFHERVFSSRERHSSSRYHTLSYPQRSIRTDQFLYIRNFRPERWPAGAPQKYGLGSYPTQAEINDLILGPDHGGYHDIDACPSLDFILENKEDSDIKKFLDLAVAHRPEEELFDIQKDPSCLHNLSEEVEFQSIKNNLWKELSNYLTETQDTRILDGGEIWETYPRYSKLRKFPQPNWAITHPEKSPKLSWLEERWKKFITPKTDN